MFDAIVKKLYAAGDFFTAGFMECEDGFFGAVKAYLDRAPLPEYTGTRLYPLCRIWNAKGILNYDYSYSAALDKEMLCKSTLDDGERAELLRKYNGHHVGGSCISDRYALSGRGFTHYCPETEKFLDRSLPEYFSMFDGNDAFRRKMSILGNAAVGYVGRVADYLATFGTDRARRLEKAYRNFLDGAAETFFDAFVRILFVFALDGMDSLGNIDKCLERFARVGGEEKLFSELYAAYENQNSWNVALGTSPDTAAVAFDGFDGASRPNFSLKVDESTPDELWNACFSAMERGARPAFYNRRGYERALIELGADESDISRISYGGCSETMLSGLSNVGSIDAGIDLLHIFSEVWTRRNYTDFSELYTDYLENVRKNIRTVVREVNDEMLAMRSRPQYIRTLLCPPCAESGREFNDGGAKYNFSVIHICALANAADSLYALKKLVFEEKRFGYAEVAEITKNDFTGGEKYLAALASLEFFGNDNAETDGLAAEIFDAVCDELGKYKTAFGGGAFLPACIMFNTAVVTGKMTEATPDGRRAYSPVANSGGSVTGRDRVSPTALLNSVLKIRPMRAVGSWIVNITLSSDFVKGEKARAALKALILAYMHGGGCQLQINLADGKQLCAAVDDDELARTIIVRVGGFSERFSNLSREMRKFIADRTRY